MPGVYEFLEAERIKYAIRLPTNKVLQERISYLLNRPVGRLSNEVRRYHASFSYQAATWDKPRRVIAKVKWHPGELFPRAGFIVTNMSRAAENVVAFYNKRGTCEQWIKEGKGRSSGRDCRAGRSLPTRCGGGFMRDQDRRQGGEPRSLHRLPDGGSRHPEGPKAKVRPDEGKIDIPGLERTAVANLGAWQT